MILDNQGLLSDDQDLAQTAAAYASTNYIDLGPIDSSTTREMGKGVPLPILIQVTEAFTSAGAATLQVELEVDDNTSFSSATAVWDSGAIAKGTLVVGYKFLIDFVPRGVNERYLRINYTIGTATTTAGKVTAAVGSGGNFNLPN